MEKLQSPLGKTYAQTALNVGNWESTEVYIPDSKMEEWLNTIDSEVEAIDNQQATLCKHIFDDLIATPAKQLESMHQHTESSYSKSRYEQARQGVWHIAEAMDTVRSRFAQAEDSMSRVVPDFPEEAFDIDDARVVVLIAAWRRSALGPISFDPGRHDLTYRQEVALRFLLRHSKAEADRFNSYDNSEYDNFNENYKAITAPSPLASYAYSCLQDAGMLFMLHVNRRTGHKRS